MSSLTDPAADILEFALSGTGAGAADRPIEAVVIALNAGTQLVDMLHAVAEGLTQRVLHCDTHAEAEQSIDQYPASVVVVRQSELSNTNDLARLAASGSGETRVLFVRDGAGEPPWGQIHDVIVPPLDLGVLRLRLRSMIGELSAQVALGNALRQQDQITRSMRHSQEEMIERLQLAEAQSKSAYLDLVFRLATAAEARDGETADHLHRMSQYSQIVGQAMGLPDDDLFILSYASMMHDVGKIAVPDAVLFKPGRLTRQEWDIMKQHTTAGARIVGDAQNPLLQASAIIAEGHHEKWDGSGYPHGVGGEDIPLFARIVAIADVFDALTTRRCYKAAFANERAYEIIEQGRGSHFQPEIVDAFFSKRESIERTQAQTAQSLVSGPSETEAPSLAIPVQPNASS